MTDGTNGKEAPRRSDDDFIATFLARDAGSGLDGIQRFAESKGQSKLFYQTITIFFTLLIYQRIGSASSSASWEAFREANPDLFRFKECILRYYDQETLNSDLARHSFVFPNRAGG